MSQTCKEPIIKSSRWFDRSGIHALILMAVIMMIPLLLSVPAYETRLGPFLHQERTENLFQGHCCIFTIGLLFSILPTEQHWFCCLVIPGPSLVERHFVSRWHFSLGLGRWGRGGGVCGPGVSPEPTGPHGPHSADISWLSVYQDVQATTQPAAKRKTFTSDKGERKYILNKAFLVFFCFVLFFTLLTFIYLILHLQWFLKFNQLFGIFLVLKKKYEGH